MGIFTTTIRTGLGEELTIPNSLITGAITKNYSRAVEGRGYVVDTTVTIGYDTPWRQVEAMLIEAARAPPAFWAIRRPGFSRPHCPTTTRSTGWSLRPCRASRDRVPRS